MCLLVHVCMCVQNNQCDEPSIAQSRGVQSAGESRRASDTFENISRFSSSDDVSSADVSSASAVANHSQLSEIKRERVQALMRIQKNAPLDAKVGATLDLSGSRLGLSHGVSEVRVSGVRAVGRGRTQL